MTPAAISILPAPPLNGVTLGLGAATVPTAVATAVAGTVRTTLDGAPAGPQPQVVATVDMGMVGAGGFVQPQCVSVRVAVAAVGERVEPVGQMVRYVAVEGTC